MLEQEKRRDRIMAVLRSSGSARIDELAEQLGVSINTIRRDFDLLAEAGLLRKVYGGAVPVQQSSAQFQAENPPLSNLSFSWSRADSHAEERRRISRYAAGLVQDGESIALGLGTTCAAIAHYLRDRENISVLTNNLAVLNELVYSRVRVQALGGQLNGYQLSMVDSQMLSVLNSFNVERTFVGIAGISLDKGMTDLTRDGSQLNATFISRARHSYIVADSSKFDRVAFSHTGDLNVAHTLITDSGIPETYVHSLRECGTEVIIVR